MKKFLVILLVLMTCFVANVNAQEWRWTGDFFSGGEYKLTKQNLSYKIIFLSSNMYVNCIKNTTIKSIDIEGDYLKIHIEDRMNGCAETKLSLKLDGSGGFRNEFINSNWVITGSQRGLKFSGGASLESLVAGLKDKSVSTVTQNELKTTNNTNPIDLNKREDTIATPVKVSRSEPEKAKVQEVVPNLNPQEWNWIYKKDSNLVLTLSLIKIDNSYKLRVVGATNFGCKNKIFNNIELINSNIIVTFEHSAVFCGKNRLIIKTDGSNAFEQDFVNGEWVNNDINKNMKYVGGAPIESLVAGLKEKTTNLASQNETKPSAIQNPDQDKINQNKKIIEEVNLKEQQQRVALEAQQKEQARLAQDSAKQKEQERLLAEQNAKEPLRVAEESKLKDQQRLALEDQQKEQAHLAQEAKQKEQDRLLADQKVKEQLRVAEETAKANALELAKLKQELASMKLQKENAAPAPSARKALVIGNDNYSSVAKLSNARQDANAVGRTLSDLGYKVMVKNDLNEKDMKATLRQFKNDLEGGDEVVIFYAGHGIQIGSTNYLLPTDIKGESEDQVRDDAIQLQRLLDDMNEKKVKLTLAMIDACRDNPFPKAGRAIGSRGLAPTTAATGQMIIFSAGSGQQALDKLGPNDKNPNGLFTRMLLSEMKTQGVRVDNMIREVRRKVVDAAKSVGHEQVPAIYDQVVGDFYFNK